MDLLVVLPFRGNDVAKAIEIRSRFNTPFPLDLIVRKPEFIVRRERERDMFIELLMIEGLVMFPLTGARLSGPKSSSFQPKTVESAGLLTLFSTIAGTGQFTFRGEAYVLSPDIRPIGSSVIQTKYVGISRIGPRRQDAVRVFLGVGSVPGCRRNA